MAAEVVARALALCREHVTGWQTLAEADFRIEPVTGGLTNLLYKCTNTRRDAAPPHVLLRVYVGA